jgi:hypothetical protein
MTQYPRNLKPDGFADPLWALGAPAAPPPRWMPLPQLLYAQGVKTVRRRRLVRGRHRVVFGTLEAGHQGLTVCGWHINTAFVERLNLHLRQHGAAIGRRVTTLGKHAGGVRQPLAW